MWDHMHMPYGFDTVVDAIMAGTTIYMSHMDHITAVTGQIWMGLGGSFTASLTKRSYIKALSVR